MIEQIAISIFGVTAIWLSQDLRFNYRKYACIFGILGQPFWFYSAYAAEQWGIFVLCFFYAFSWLKGINSYWFNKETIQTDTSELKSKLDKANEYNILLEEQLKEADHTADYNFKMYQDLSEVSFKTDNELLEYINKLESYLQKTKEVLYFGQPNKRTLELAMVHLDHANAITKPSLMQENNNGHLQSV